MRRIAVLSPSGRTCTRPSILSDRTGSMKDTALLIDCDGLLRRIAEPGLQIVDCRFELLDPEAGRRQYLRGHIPGAVYADLDVDLAGPIGPGSGRHPLPDPQTMATTLGRLGIDTGTEVVVYDQGSGAVASRLWWLLRWLGHENVRLLDGGYARWQGLGYAIEEGEVDRWFPPVGSRRYRRFRRARHPKIL